MTTKRRKPAFRSLAPTCDGPVQNCWLLIDGYNIASPIAPPGRPDPNAAGPATWLAAERESLIKRLVKHLPPTVRARTILVFDAKNPPPPEVREETGDTLVRDGLTVRFAVDYDEADDLIEEIIADQSTPKQLMVVSSDRRLQTAAARRGASHMDSDPWFDWLIDDRIKLAVPPSKYADDEKPTRDKTRQQKNRRPADDEVDDWMNQFGFDR